MALTSAAISDAFLAACNAELDALKPGNVHRHQGGHHMTVATFEAAAEAAAPHIGNASLSVGARILKATDASVDATGVNTNLGIVLLCAPLAKAAGETDLEIGLRRRLAMILADTTVADARDAFAAIRRANPAGLGNVDNGDVSNDGPNDMTLTAAMMLAADRDRIARAYVTAFEDVFDVALPVYHQALTDTEAALGPSAEARNWAVTTLHMRLLSEFHDSHLLRKFGAEIAEKVRAEAHHVAAACGPFAAPQYSASLLAFDRRLKDAGLNPGTTADFVVATVFTSQISRRKGP